jgi:hypothetical protein
MNQFRIEYETDPTVAVDNIKDRLKNERAITQRYVRARLKSQYPDVVTI